ncbi:histone deacetylase family protein [Phaeovibrio sulfidiphilus]|uniref:Histone deacetylase family protein n=1 Tax=Phaeovibrio sulfidiphilus TaxID=1220600 RepID=A0A8J7CE49_9PROT|nr:histone deacetylase family protein [Phaeovibrio sulfidiphilus]MBE1237534.1 histone deacetylase family protein [Phaeovibrio sulfidiphilus]
MTTLLISHPACLEHDPGVLHPENPTRLRAILRILEMETFAMLEHAEAPYATREQLLRVHPLSYIEEVFQSIPREGCKMLSPEDNNAAKDEDTYLCCSSEEALLRAAGGVILAVDAVMSEDMPFRNAFVPIRPPGHHAERDKAMGFCLFNNVAIGALHAREQWGAERVAVVDFDVHHGNGVQHIFWDDPSLFYASTHEVGLFPFTGHADEKGAHGNIVNCPLPRGSNGDAFREAYTETIFPALTEFKPDLLMICAGFDGHVMDPMSSLELKVEDFRWVTSELLKIARETCNSRVVSTLEGGYDITSLASSVSAHIKTLMEE